VEMPLKHPDMTVEELFIRVDGKKLYVKKIIPKLSDDKPTFILLHDALGSVAQWKDFPELLAGTMDCQVICYDRAGYGLSSDGDGYVFPGYFENEAFLILPELIRQLSLSKLPIIAGHSDGGTIALLYASKHPASAIIALSAHVVVENETIKGVKETAAGEEHIINKLRKYHGERAHTVFHDWVNVWTSAPMKNWNILKELSGIKDPVLVIQGRDDQYASFNHPELIRQFVAGKAKCLLVPDCGHFPHREAQKTVLKEIEGFLGEQLKLFTLDLNNQN